MGLDGLFMPYFVACLAGSIFTICLETVEWRRRMVLLEALVGPADLSAS